MPRAPGDELLVGRECLFVWPRTQRTPLRERGQSPAGVVVQRVVNRPRSGADIEKWLFNCPKAPEL